MPERLSPDAQFAIGVKTARERQGMTQAALARMMSERPYDYRWHQATVYKVENGDRKVTVGEALALENILNVDIDTMALPQSDTEKALYRHVWNAADRMALAILRLDQEAGRVEHHRRLLLRNVTSYRRRGYRVDDALHQDVDIADVYRPLLDFYLAGEVEDRMRNEVFADPAFQEVFGDVNGVVGPAPRGSERALELDKEPR